MTQNVATNGVNAGKPANEVQEQPMTEQPKKKFRRGITNETRSVTRLKYDESLANRSNGLFMGVIDSVDVQTVDFKEDNNGMPSFAGETVPVFVVNFHSLHDTPEKWRWVPLRLMPAESNANTIPFADDAWKVDNVTGTIKHLLEVVYLHGRKLTEKEEDALTLPFEDFTITDDGKFVYEPIEAKVVLEGYKQVFENAAAMLNGTWNLEPNTTPKPAYVNKDGKKTWYWLKLLRFIKNKKNQWRPVAGTGSNAGDLAFSSFIGSGIIEKYEKEVAPSLRVDPAKESIIPQKWQAEPSAPKTPAGVAGGVPMGGVNPIFGGTPDMGAGQAPVDYNQFADPTASDDMPF